MAVMYELPFRTLVVQGRTPYTASEYGVRTTAPLYRGPYVVQYGPGARRWRAANAGECPLATVAIRREVFDMRLRVLVLAAGLLWPTCGFSEEGTMGFYFHSGNDLLSWCNARQDDGHSDQCLAYVEGASDMLEELHLICSPQGVTARARLSTWSRSTSVSILKRGTFPERALPVKLLCRRFPASNGLQAFHTSSSRTPIRQRAAKPSRSSLKRARGLLASRSSALQSNSSCRQTSTLTTLMPVGS